MHSSQEGSKKLVMYKLIRSRVDLALGSDYT